MTEKGQHALDLIKNNFTVEWFTANALSERVGKKIAPATLTSLAKQKIRIVDNINHKVIESEKEIPNKMHFEAQIRYRANVYRDRTKYTRKQKHRNRNDYEDALLV